MTGNKLLITNNYSHNEQLIESSEISGTLKVIKCNSPATKMDTYS